MSNNINNPLTETREIIKLAEAISEKMGCAIDKNEARRHSEVLAVLPEKIDTIIKNQERHFETLDNYEKRISELEKDVVNIPEIRQNQIEIFDRLRKSENDIKGIFVGRKIFFWTLGIVCSALAVLADWFFRLWDKINK